MPTSTLTSKGRITIPKDIREQLRLRTGHRIEFRVDSGGKMVLTPQSTDFRSLKGLLRSKRNRKASIREMHQTIAEGASTL